MKMIKENGFINDNYIVTVVEADCFWESKTFLICARRWDEFCTVLRFSLMTEDKCRNIGNECCDIICIDGPFTIENVTKEAKEYLEAHALEMYARLKRRLQAEKVSVSFSYYEGDYEYGDIGYEDERICISIPRSILGDKLCGFIEAFDGYTKIAFDKENDAVKIYHSFIYMNEKHKRHIEEVLKTELYDKNFEEEAKQILSMFKSIEDTSEETTAVSKEDAVLV